MQQQDTQHNLQVRQSPYDCPAVQQDATVTTDFKPSPLHEKNSIVQQQDEKPPVSPLEWLKFDPRNNRPSSTTISRAYEVVDALTDLQSDSRVSAQLQEQITWKIQLINDWCSMASRHVSAYNLAMQGHEVIDFLAEDQQNMGWVQETSPPSNLPCQRIPGDPNSIAMSKCLHDPARNLYYKLFKTVKKTIYGEIKLGIVCQPGPDGVQQHTAEHVAVKVFRRLETVQQTNAAGDQLLENGIREIVALRYVSMPGHPHVQPMVSCLLDPEKIYVVQERASGSLLDDMVNSQVSATSPDGLGHVATSCYSIGRVRRFCQQMARGLDYLHNCGIAHRDVSLENTLKYAGDVVKLIDLGLCTPMILASAQAPNNAWAPVRYEGPVGKLRYMAPEVFQPSAAILQTGFYDATLSDVWSLGCCFFTLLFNRQPYSRPSRALCQLYNQLVVEGLLTPKALRAVQTATGASTQVEVELCQLGLELVSRMLCEEPTQRPGLSDILSDPFLAV